MLARSILGNELGTKICKLVGLSPNDVSHITIDIPADDIVRVIVTFKGDESVADAIYEVLKSADDIRVIDDTAQKD